MPDQQAAAGGAAAAPRQEEEGTSFFRSALNGFMIFLAAQFVLGQLGITNPGSKTSGPAPAYDDASYPTAEKGSNSDYDFQYIPQQIFPMWPIDAPLDISVYVTTSLSLPPLGSPESESAKVFNAENYVIGNSNEKRGVSVDIPLEHLGWEQGGQIYAHVLVIRSEAVARASWDHSTAFAFRKPLVRYLPKKKVVKTKKLLGGDSKEEEKVEEAVEEEPELPAGQKPMAPYWHANLTLETIDNSGELPFRTLPPVLRQHVILETTGARDSTGKNGWYYPIFYANEFWHLKEHMIELNDTVKSLPMHINLYPSKYWKFQLYASMDESFKQQANKGLSSGSELEEFKRVLMDTNIYLLSTTFIVSILHTIFEMLAFKSDISHWKNKKDNVGVSFRTILANVLMQTIIFLYLVDNSEGTSWMILGGQGFGILLEAWKITKTVDVKVVAAPRGSLLPYKVTFEDKHKLSDLERETKEYDEIAFRYLYIIAVPLLLAYAVYSVLYESHKSWYSFIITTLVGSVYAYGFLMMVPSLYINYRLKSVAHMPRKAMMYKFLNTFIDDLFAFTIKMPTLHRLATLRDDVIFFIYLYQAYVYKTDPKRVNEFGQVAEPEDEEPENKGDEKKVERAKKVEEIEGVATEKAEGASGVEASEKEGLRKR